METIKQFFEGRSAGSVIGLLVAALLVLGFAVWALFRVLQTPQAALFESLPQADAAEVAAKLEEWKSPHSFSADGGQILVPADEVHALRMRLVSEGIPSGGRVGFELFKESDFGVTEFAQQVNYQRGLQGELERTIAALDEVADVRVHLTLPRSTGLLRGSNPTKASVALTLVSGSTLSPAQVSGVQSLVASAVNGLPAEDVVVVDQRGQVLSGGALGGAGLAAQLDEQARVEQRLRVRLDDLLGQGFALTTYRLSVDVQLNFDKVSRVSERLLEQGAEGNGLLVRSRTDSASQPGTEVSTGTETKGQEREWAHGREREETAVAPGRIAKLSIALVVPAGTTPQQLDRLKRAVSAAAGIDDTRGDRLEIVAFGPDIPAPEASDGLAEVQALASDGSAPIAAASVAPVQRVALELPWRVLAIGGALVVLVLVILLLARPREGRLTARERDARLAQIKAWLEEPGAVR
jgi:flagellar M-ring protein FliF